MIYGKCLGLADKYKVMHPNLVLRFSGSISSL